MRFRSLIALLSVTVRSVVFVAPSQTPSRAQQPTGTSPSAATPVVTSPQGAVTGSMPSPFGAQAQPNGLNIVVLDPAHGGTDPGARGTGGIRESEIVLDFATQVRRALELQGFQVVQTRQGNEDPSFVDGSPNANAERGAAAFKPSYVVPTVTGGLR